MIRDGAKSGHSAAGIARDIVAVGFAAISPSQIRKIMKQAGDAAESTLPDDFRTTELARLAQLQKALHAKALKGDNAAVDRVLAILDRRAKLLGLGAPKPADEASETNQAQAKEILLQKLEAMAARLARAPKPPANGEKPAADETR
jgi:hypothetical protein